MYLGALSRIDFLYNVHRRFRILLRIFGVLLAKLYDGQVTQRNRPQFVVVNFATRFARCGKEQFRSLQVTKTVIQRTQLQI